MRGTQLKIVGGIVLVAGIALLVWRARFVRSLVYWQERMFDMRYGPVEVQMVNAVVVLGGIIAIIMSLLMLGGVGVKG